MNDLPVRHHRALVIGAGISGIGAAITLRRLGIDDFVVLDKGDSFGGTWRDNTYPGCACDVPSMLYSYSFAPNRDWSRLFAGQAEIRRYVEATAADHGVAAHTRFGVEVLQARWDDDHHRWLIETTAGSYTAEFLLAAAGPWNDPLTPAIPGLESFPGKRFHSSQWDHDYDLTGKRVAVIGTGASAVQFVPAVQPQVERLHVYQRTAQWVLPKPDAALSPAVRTALARIPGAAKALRRIQYGLMETLGIGFRHPRMLRAVQRLGRRHLRTQVADRELRRILTPDYTLGCKRLLMSNTYYPALAQPNVDVHAGAAARFEGSTLVGADGSRAEVDAVIFGTGFHITDMPIAARVFDADGRCLEDHWDGSPQAYLGTTVTGFPNLFLLLGPALGTGHSSAFMILEAQLRHVRAVLSAARQGGWTRFVPRAEVQRAFNAEVQHALRTTVYNAGGCHSYYLDRNGRNSFSWPWSTTAMRTRLAAFEPGDFAVATAESAGALRLPDAEQEMPAAGGER